MLLTFDLGHWLLCLIVMYLNRLWVYQWIGSVEQRVISDDWDHMWKMLHRTKTMEGECRHLVYNTYIRTWTHTDSKSLQLSQQNELNIEHWLLTFWSKSCILPSYITVKYEEQIWDNDLLCFMDFSGLYPSIPNQPLLTVLMMCFWSCRSITFY